MGVVFFLFLWPIVLAVGIFAILLPYIPYIVLAHGIVWLGIGLLARYIFNKHQLFEKGLSYWRHHFGCRIHRKRPHADSSLIATDRLM